MHLLVLGANSDIGLAIARKFSQAEGAHLYLASRDVERLKRKASDLEIRFGITCVPLYFDALDYSAHKSFYDRLDPKPDGVVMAFGYLGKQQEAQLDFVEAKRIIDTNFLGAVSILEHIAADFETRGRGFVIGIGSVAGDRGRRSNYIYGSAKGALGVYLSGLRGRLYEGGVRVLTVLPGFTRTKMTEGMNLPRPLTAEPAEVAEDVYRAYKKGKDVVYTRWLWKWIMMIVKTLPESIFKRMKL